MILDTTDAIKNINALIDSQGTVILDNKKVFLNLIKDVIQNTTDEQSLLCYAVENDVLDLLYPAISNGSDEKKFSKELSSFVDKTIKSYTEQDKEFVFQVFLGVFSHCTGKSVAQNTRFDTDEQETSQNIAKAARLSGIMNGIAKYLPKSFNPIIIPIVLFVAMEIAVVVCLTNTDIINNSINESLGTFVGLQFGAIIHALIGAILGRLAKQKWLSYIPAVISTIIAVYCFFTALADLEGFFITILGFFFFGAIALGVSALCIMLPTWINKA